MKHLIIVIFLINNSLVNAQTFIPEERVHQFFQAMADANAEVLDEITSDDLFVQSTSLKDGLGMIKGGDKASFIASVAKTEAGVLNEQISNLEINTQDGLSTIWMDYSFYLNGNFSHCGVNNFTLAKEGNEWKIISIVDTRSKSDCLVHDSKTEINQLINDWHLAASKADSMAYFSAMTIDAIYVGTDKEEVWSKRDFTKFADPYFAKGKAWDFKTISRNVYSDDYNKLAWFDEMLDTWMGPCRGSGVVVRVGEEWKIKHYVLSLTIPNDDIEKVVKVLKKPQIQK